MKNQIALNEINAKLQDLHPAQLHLCFDGLIHTPLLEGDSNGQLHSDG